MLNIQRSLNTSSNSTLVCLVQNGVRLIIPVSTPFSAFSISRLHFPKTSFSATGTGEVPVKGIFDKVFEIGLSSRMAQVSEFEGDTVVPFLLSSVAINDSTREYSRTGLNGLAFRNGNDGQNELNILNSLNGLRTTKSGENGVRIDDNNYTDLRTGVKIISRDYRNETLVRPSQGRLVKSY